LSEFRSSFSTGVYWDGVFHFRTWAPECEGVTLRMEDGEELSMKRGNYGIWETELSEEGDIHYRYMLGNEGPYPDPSSRFQPTGVEGPSMISSSFQRSGRHGRWKGISLCDMIIEEVHIGTFTPQGTFRSAARRLERIAETGINSVEIMPVAQFYGSRNWGYDGVYLYATQNSYGTPSDLAYLVDRAHELGVAILLDVVYNHLGPVGNYLDRYGPYFSSVYSTPWGRALNFDGPGSDVVRQFILDNVHYWLDEIGFDGLRLDATHAIYDASPTHILSEISALAERIGRKDGRRIVLIAENDRNDRHVVLERRKCGLGLSAQWNDDFHHALHVLLTGERDGYYSDYRGLPDLCKSLSDGFVYDGIYSQNSGRIRGTKWKSLPKERLVVCSQNHDQIGNRAEGERLSFMVSPQAARFAAACVLLSPFTPMLFMGEEYGERAPFLFFIDSSDSDFAEMVYRGRLAEFSRFGWKETPRPDALETFMRCKLSSGSGVSQRAMKRYYSDLIEVRRRYISQHRESLCVHCDEGEIILEYGKVHVLLSTPQSEAHKLKGRVLLNSEWKMYGGKVEPGRSVTADGYCAAVLLH